MTCIHALEKCHECDPLLPEPRIVRLHINGVCQHFYTWSEADLDDLRFGDLSPYPAMDSWAWLEGIHKPKVV